MVKQCVVFDCYKTRKSGVALHKFPEDNRSRQAWIEFVRIQIPDWEGPNEFTGVCSNHFTEDNYSSNYALKEEAGQPCRRRLKEGAIPTLFKKEDEDTVFEYDSRSCSPVLDSIEPGYSGENASFTNAEEFDTAFEDREEQGELEEDISAETSKLSIDQNDVSQSELPNEESAADSLALFRQQLAEFPESPSRRKEPIILNICDLNSYITCALCGGYLYEASTITECMHTFCKTCLVRHAEKSLTCPTCDTIIHPTDPFVHIRHDSTIQDIVYRLLPKVAEEEQKREKEFYEEHERRTGEVIAPKLQLPPPPPKTPPPRSIPVMPQRMTKKRRGMMNFNSQFVSLSLEFSGEFEGYKDDACELDLEKKFVRVTSRATVGNVANFVKKKLRLDNIYTVDLLHKLQDQDEKMIEEKSTLANMRDELYSGEDCIIDLMYRIRTC